MANHEQKEDSSQELLRSEVFHGILEYSMILYLEKHSAENSQPSPLSEPAISS